LIKQQSLDGVSLDFDPGPMNFLAYANQGQGDILLIFNNAIFIYFLKGLIVQNKTKILLACSAIAISNLAFAQSTTSEPAATTGASQSSSDPIIQNRMEKAKAKAEYRKKKKIAKQDLSAKKKEANQKLRSTEQQSSAGATVEPSK
jgi:hypothetical protein